MSGSQDTIYILDRLVNKPVQLQVPTDHVTTSLQPQDYVVYKDDEGNDMAGIFLGYTTVAEKKGTYLYPLKDTELKLFLQGQEKAQQAYLTFEKEFGAAFPTSKPLTARMNLQGNQIYFYFFAETRYNFADFVRSFREKVRYKFFLYQVGSRDRVRLHPHLEERYDPSGLPLMYHIFKHGLENVDGDTVAIQQLNGRHSERLKDRSGKLDHTLNFEKAFYEEANKQYPRYGEIISYYDQKMRCTGYNVLTEEITLRGKGDEQTAYRNGEFKKISLDDYQTAQQKARANSSRSTAHGSTKNKQVSSSPADKIKTSSTKKSTSTRRPSHSTRSKKR